MRDSRKNRLLLAAAAGTGALLAYSALRGSTYNFARKTVLITGSSRGLGLAIARELARRGANVVLCARDAGELERAREQVSGFGAEVLAVSCDVTDPEQVKNMIATIESRYGRVDVLINNAGTIAVGPLESLDLEDFEKAMRINFWGPLHTVLAVLPSMRARGGGRIVNISSVGGKISVPHMLPYSASKFALVGLSRGLRTELKKDGIVVTTVCPGLMRTGSPRNATFKGNAEAEYAWFSLSDSLPLTSMNADRAAEQVLSACAQGDAEVVLSIQAKAAVAFDALFPGWNAELMALVNSYLPSSQQGPAKKGADSETPITRSRLTDLTGKAERENNQL